MKKWLRIAGWLVVGLTSLFFLQSGIQKVIGTEMMVEHFHVIAYPDWSRIVIGMVEIAGAIFLIIPRFTMFAASALAVLMVGAVLSKYQQNNGLAL